MTRITNNPSGSFLVAWWAQSIRRVANNRNEKAIKGRRKKKKKKEEERRRRKLPFTRSAFSLMAGRNMAPTCTDIEMNRVIRRDTPPAIPVALSSTGEEILKWCWKITPQPPWLHLRKSGMRNAAPAECSAVWVSFTQPAAPIKYYRIKSR